MGPQVGITSQADSSIIINAGKTNLLENLSNYLVIQPNRIVITDGWTTNLMCYDDTNKQVVHATNINFLNPVQRAILEHQK